MPIYGAVWYQGEANAGVCFVWNNYNYVYIHAYINTFILTNILTYIHTAMFLI